MQCNSVSSNCWRCRRTSMTGSLRDFQKPIFIRAKREMLLAKIADGTEVRTLLPHHRHERQVTLAGQSNLAARTHPDAVGIEQQTDHHSGIKRWGASGFRLIGGIEAA